MSSVVDGVGAAVEGGFLASTVEPRHGGAVPITDGHTAESACLNCGTRLQDEYCGRCGQHSHVHRTLGAFGHDLLHGVLHLDSKIWRTLPKLIFNPGELTRRYIRGERARFISPLALFLFSVFLMFAVMNFLGSLLDKVDSPPRMADTVDYQRKVTENEAKLRRLQRERAAVAGRGVSTGTLDSELRKTELTQRILIDLVGGDDEVFKQTKIDRDARAYQADRAAGRAFAGREADSADGTFDAAYKTAKKNPKLLLYKMRTNAYKFSWALILISVPFVALLFLWRRRPVYDHAVFVTYSIAAMSILTILGSLLIIAGVLPGIVFMAALLFVPWHMYRQIRGGYELRRFSALWRTLLLLIFANVALIVFSIGLLMLGVLG